MSANPWPKGQAEIEVLLRQNKLGRVQPSREQADQLLAACARHLSSAALIKHLDPEGGFSTVYDAARKALAAVLVNQGLRATSEGGHKVLLDAVLAQVEPPPVRALREFDWMRKRRNNTEYPDYIQPVATEADVDEALEVTEVIVAKAKQLVEAMARYHF